MRGPLLLYLSSLVEAAPLVALRAYQFEAALEIVAFRSIARGMTCPATT